MNYRVCDVLTEFIGLCDYHVHKQSPLVPCIFDIMPSMPLSFQPRDNFLDDTLRGCKTIDDVFRLIVLTISRARRMRNFVDEVSDAV